MTQWFLKKYNALSKEALYEIIQFRIGIFMLEQQSFYKYFGFSVDGKPYDDGGIMHILMVKYFNP